MSNFWPFNYIWRRNQQPIEETEPAQTTDDAQNPEANEHHITDFSTFRSIVESNPQFLSRILEEPSFNPTPGPSIPRNEPENLPDLEMPDGNDSHLSEAARRLRKRRLEQRIADREHRLRAREEETESFPNIRSDPVSMNHDNVDITFQRTAHRQERRFGLLVINNLLPSCK